MNDTTYEAAVTAIVGEAACTRHKAALFELNIDLRHRLISSLKLGLSIENAITHVQRSAVLPEENYNRYIRYIAANYGS